MSGNTPNARPALQRQLGAWSATALVVSNMIGTGALSNSELGVNFPTSGGEYVYLRQAYGPGGDF